MEDGHFILVIWRRARVIAQPLQQHTNLGSFHAPSVTFTWRKVSRTDLWFGMLLHSTSFLPTLRSKAPAAFLWVRVRKGHEVTGFGLRLSFCSKDMMVFIRDKPSIRLRDGEGFLSTFNIATDLTNCSQFISVHFNYKGNLKIYSVSTTKIMKIGETLTSSRINYWTQRWTN